jgi:Carboxypeptidase regulatory-like domain/TonB dependent receptor/TonB-dependent Receptor Plug Domain
MSSSRPAFGFLCCSLIFGTILSQAGAQVVGGSLSGTVIDSTGALIPRAQISILNPATGDEHTVVTDVAGFYLVPNLLPGSYKVTAVASGFATTVRGEVALLVGSHQILNFTLEVAGRNEVVHVVTETPLVELGSSSIGAIVDSTTIRELPLNGRSWTDLATLQPGVNNIETQRTFNSGPGAAGRAIRGFGAQLTISGARPQQNNYRLDGISVNDHSNAGPGSVLGGNLGVDAIQEFSVLTSNYSAEYGRTSGGVVNATTRSGTNAFHGSVYEFLRNSALDARNFFDGSKIPPFKRNQFGAAGGAPILKDRTFIFGDYEGVRQSKGITQVDTVPSQAARTGNLSSGQVKVDPVVSKYLGFYPVPNGALLGAGDTGIFTFPAQQVINENFVTSRVDHKISQSDSLFGTYVYDSTPYTSPDNLDNEFIGNKTKRQLVAIEDSHTFSASFINALRVGFNRALTDGSVNQAAINPLAKDITLGAVPGETATGVAIPGITQFSGGLGGQGTFQFRFNSFQLYDDAYFTKGAHSIKFGYAGEYIQLNSLQTDIPNGTFTFSSLSNFLQNRPKRLDLPLPGKLSPRDIRQSLLGLYLQDDWQLRTNLMLNLGVRYEMTTVPTETRNKLSTLLLPTDAAPHLGNPYFLNPTLLNFEPRVGVAWDPFHSGKTAVRAGFGIFDVLPLPYEVIMTVYLPSPFHTIGSASNLPPGSFPAGGLALLGPHSLNATYVEHKPRRNYVMQWNLNIQQQITPSLTGMVAYVGSRGVHQPFRSDDLDIVPPTKTAEGYFWPSPVGSGTVINPNFGSIRSVVWRGDSYFHALETQLTNRMSHGFQVQGSFTWARSIDTSSSSQASDQFTNSISSLPSFNMRLGRGLSDFSIGRTLTINGTWQIPNISSRSTLVGWTANGWELGVIYRASDGTPFSATFGTDGDPLGLNSSDPWDFPNRLSGSECKSLINPGNSLNYIKTQCFAIPTASPALLPLCDPSLGVPPQCFNLRGNAGRNILIGPGISNMDFSIFKNFPGERFKVQLRAEFFNVLNRANFAPPITPDHTDIFDSTGALNPSAGLLTSTTTTAREVQLAVKVTW